MRQPVSMNKSPGYREVFTALGEIRSILEEQVASLQDHLDHAVEVMRENTEEVGVLRDAIDELRDLYQWTLNNARPNTPTPFQLSSMPVDPTADDWSARLNGVSRNIFGAYERRASEPAATRVPSAEPEGGLFQLRAKPGAAQNQQRLF